MVKCYNIKNAVVSQEFDDFDKIFDLVISKKDEIIKKNTNPSVKKIGNKEVYTPEKVCLDDKSLYLSIEDIYDYGIVYNISNTVENRYDNIETAAKLIIGNNVASFIIDRIDYVYNNDDSTIYMLKTNIETENTLIKSLGSKIKINKLYGEKSNNKLLEKFNKIQANVEKEVIKHSVERSFYVLEESIEKERKIRIRK